MRVLIVDDETLARSILREHLAKLPGVEIVGEAANGFEAVKLAEELNPELVFLDIQMPKLSGFEVLELLGERAPSVIFTTAFDEFALRAFEVHAVDYLLKPVEPPRLAAAVERAAERLRNKTPAPSAHDLAVVGAAAGPHAGAHPDPPRRPRARAAARAHRLHRGAGRLPVVLVRRQAAAQAADDERPGNPAGSRRVSCASIARSFSTSSAWRASTCTARTAGLQSSVDGTKLPMSRTGHAKLKELIG